MNAIQKKQMFAHTLAEFLGGPFTATASIVLEMHGNAPTPLNEWAKHWAAIRNCSPVTGWASAEEAEDALCEFFGVNPPARAVTRRRAK